MLRKFFGYFFSIVAGMSAINIIMVAFWQGQARVNEAIESPGEWDLALGFLLLILSIILTLAIWPEEE